MARFRFLLARFKPTTLLPLGDLLLVDLAILLALQLWAMRDGQESIAWDFILSHVYWVLGLSALWLLVAVIQGLYTERTSSKVFNSLLALLAITGLFVLAYLVAYFFAPVGMLPRRVVLDSGVLALVLVALWRVAYIAISNGLMLARSPSVRHGGGVIEFVRQVIRETFLSGRQRVSEAPSVHVENRGIEEDLYTVQEVAELLKVHEATIWRWCRSGELPAFRVGQQWRIRASDLHRIMDAKTDTGSGRSLESDE